MLNFILPTRRQFAALAYPLPVLILLGYLPIFYNHSSSFESHLLMIFFSVLLGLLSWFTSTVVNNCTTFKIGLLQNSFLRVTIVMLVVLLFQGMFLYVLCLRENILSRFLSLASLESRIAATILGLGTNILFCSIWQMDLIIDGLKKDLQEKNSAEHHELSSKYDQLKHQINPGFLFNNFSILSSLIREDADGALEYLDKLSTVYRYFLRQDDCGFSVLSSELKFLASYNFLLYRRYGGAVSVILESKSYPASLCIPTLSLQLLIENAIKHNRCSVEEKLIISIVFKSPNLLYVKNNIQLRINPIGVHAEGLKALKFRYSQSDYPEVFVYDDNQTFTVVLPLIGIESFK